MHVVSILLSPTEYEEYELSRRYRAVWHLHNVIVKHASKQLKKLRDDSMYQDLLNQYKLLKDKQDKKSEFKTVSEQLKDIIISYGLTKSGLEKYIANNKQYDKLLSSSQIQKIADNVYKGVEKILYSTGKRLHFKRLCEITIIPGKSPINGIRFYGFGYNTYLEKSVPMHDTEVDVWGLQIKCTLKKKLKKDRSDYYRRALTGKLKYCEIRRIEYNSGYRYYVLLYLDGPAPDLLNPGKESAGIDPGTSTMAVETDTFLFLEELAPDIENYNKEIKSLQRKVERSTRISNPRNYNDDGKIKPGKHNWKLSKTCRRNKRKLRVAYRKKSASIRKSHRTLINKIVSLCGSGHVLCEKMNYQSLQKRSKNTERQEKVSEIKTKTGEVKQVRKYKKKKRFGKSLQSRAPAAFLSILKEKITQYGGTFEYINTFEVKASQYRHDTDTYEKIPLSRRTKEIDNHKIQRDCYSAFIIHHVKRSDLSHVNRKKCIKDFDQFVLKHDLLINKMQETGITKKECFGF